VDSHKGTKDEAILTSVAESIGSTLGTIAAKAGAVQKAFTDKVSEAKPRVRRAAKRATAAVKKGTRPAMKRARKSRAVPRSRKNKAAASSRHAKRKL
jgi:hypothetical protein